MENVRVQGAVTYRWDVEATAEADPAYQVSGKGIALVCEVPVPQTDTGIRDEYSKARE